MCPYDQTKCGALKEIILSVEGETQNVTTIGMVAGDSCSYTMAAACG